ncbi:MAG TPA: protein kinase [Nannocystaceae bacterium]|nr:protein kinase [Nannocystaceae bacterium]
MSAVSPEDSRADLLMSGESVAFGKYQLTRLIARGGMGEVYLARLVGEFGFEKRLVIKTILPHLAEKPRFVELFAAEAKTAVALSHGNIVPIYELGRAGDTFYIVMGHVDGPSVAVLLDAYRRQQRIADIAVALHIVRGVLTGLAYAHTPEHDRHAVVHRDITPRNVLLDRSGQVRIVDFGIAAPADIEVDMRAGSTGYAAPEQIRSGAVDPSADVFSAAALLYELVTLERAFPKEGVWVQPDLDALPEVLRAPLRAALALDPRERPADAGAFLDRLAPAFARYAATFGDARLSAHLRELFPEGWDEHSKPAAAGALPARGKKAPKRDTQTFATRLTLVTRTPSVPKSRTGPTRVMASARRWPWLAALVVAGLATWAIVAASRPDAVAIAASDATPPSRSVAPDVRDPPVRAADSTQRSTADEHADATEPTTTPIALPTPPEPTASEPATPAIVRVALEPRDAAVLVDGQKVDAAAIELPGDRAAKVVVKKEGYAARTFVVDAAHPLPDRVELAPLGTGSLKVLAASVAYAEVTVDGKKLGHTPTKKLELVEGRHKVVVTCPAPVCQPARTMLTKTIMIKPNQTFELDAQ